MKVGSRRFRGRMSGVYMSAMPSFWKWVTVLNYFTFFFHFLKIVLKVFRVKLDNMKFEVAEM